MTKYSPFTLLQVSWPQPIEVRDNRWISPPAWDAPAMPTLPAWKPVLMDDVPCWSLDWRDVFRAGVKRWNPHEGGELCGFQVVFRIQVSAAGRLVFWDDDGSIVRRKGEIIHEDRSAHSLRRHELQVAAGDVLEVAQWQLGWEWLWTANLESEETRDQQSGLAPFRAWLPVVERQLIHPTGPPLKMYTHGRSPLCAIAAVYSLVLNGYTPSSVILFGEDQWPARTRSLFAELLPFVQVFKARDAMNGIAQRAGNALAELARRHWYVMKACIALCLPPSECCVMDDDIVILDSLDDALQAFSTAELVYSPDQDLGNGYVATWGRLLGHAGPLSTARFNAGLYWIRNLPDVRRIGLAAARCRQTMPFFWEQGLIATAYARRPTFQLPSQRYLFVLFDGLPGGIYGYDYASNPCGFAAVHYGGLAEKPSEGFAVHFLEEVLQRRRNPKKEAAAAD